MNGGQRRSVDSLSGGETFLTSLSLALALSSQIQLKGSSPLEFFFLDEALLVLYFLILLRGKLYLYLAGHYEDFLKTP